MNKKIIAGICAGSVVVIVLAFIILHPTFDKSDPIIFEQQTNGEYAYIIYQGKEYVPYCAFNPGERGKYLGYVGDHTADEIYTFKGHSETEWLISYLNSGLMNDCMLLKEKNVTEIPEGLSSEYEWNQ